MTWRAGRPDPARFGLVLCTGYWDRALFPAAAAAVAAGGLLAWEAFTVAATSARPGLPREWCLGPGEPASLLPEGYDVLGQADVPGNEVSRGLKRRLLARRS